LHAQAHAHTESIPTSQLKESIYSIVPEMIFTLSEILIQIPMAIFIKISNYDFELCLKPQKL
jgi:hypothetical protein